MLQDSVPQNEAKNTSYGVFSNVLRIVAVVCAIGGFIAGNKLADEWNGYFHEFNHAVAFGWSIAGIVSAFVWWALSIIVAACHKYLHKD